MKAFLQKIRRRAGFTLTEVLATAAIVAALCAVAVPAVIYYRRELKLTELDDNARAIFLAAQSRLTAVRSASDDFAERIAASADGSSDNIYGAEKGIDLPASEPGTETETLAAGSAERTQLYYVDQTASWLLPAGSIEGGIASGSYIVEFEPTGGTVYGVFYAESGSLTYETLTGDDAALRTRDGRRAFLRKDGGCYLGYYGADGESPLSTLEAEKLPTPVVELVNAEKLVLYISADAGTEDISHIGLSVSVGGTVIELGTGTEIFGGGHIDEELVLDSLDEGESFADLVDGVAPGEDFTATVSIYYDSSGGGAIAALPQIVSVTGNSLFASRSENENGDVVQIAYGRHLQNLNVYLNNDANTDVRTFTAEQIREIDFADEKTDGDLTSWAATYGDKTFTPIQNDALTAYDGHSLPIRNLTVNLTVKTDSGNAGLFAGTSADLSNITLIDPSVTTDEAGASAGALAGTTEGASVTNCRVYLEADDEANNETDNKDVYSDDRKISGGTAGGLIGTASGNTEISGSFASTVVEGTTVGGLVGSAAGAVIEGSYAAGYLSGTTVGGLTGTGGTIETCYAAGIIVSAEKAAAGISTSGADVSNAYAAVEYVDEHFAPAEDETVTVCGAAPGVEENGNVFYLRQIEMTFEANSGTAIAASSDMTLDAGLEGLTVRTDSKDGFMAGDDGGSIAVCTPYNFPDSVSEEDSGELVRREEDVLLPPYPYPHLDLPHYGDWLVCEDSDYGAVYWELEGGDYHFYAVYWDAREETYRTYDDLCTDHNETGIEKTGYAYLRTRGAALVPKLLNGVATAANSADAELSDALSEKLKTKTGNDYAYDVVVLDVSEEDPENMLTLSFSAGGNASETAEIRFDPGFAAAFYINDETVSVEKVGGADPRWLTEPGKDGNPFQVRTAGQLQHVKDHCAAGTFFEQTHDVDGNGVYDFAPIGGTDGSFPGSYDGQEYRVLDLSISAGGGNVGLFASVTGTLENIIMYTDTAKVVNTTEDANANKEMSVGALAGSVATGGTVEHCTVEGYTVTGGGAANTGGVVGSVTGGTVSNCDAVNCTVTNSGATNTGGFAGSVTDGTVSNCGARVDSGDSYKEKKVTGGDITSASYAGGFAGHVGGEADIEKCYAAVKVYGGTAGGFAGLVNGGKIADSYAGGHTEGGRYTFVKYDKDEGNVHGKQQAGGFAGLLGGNDGSKSEITGVCYATCSVYCETGYDLNSDTFAMTNGNDGNFKVEGTCYTRAQVYRDVSNSTGGETDTDSNSAAVSGYISAKSKHLTDLDQRDGKITGDTEEYEPQNAYPYDQTLVTLIKAKDEEGLYPYRNAAGGHYGDWPMDSDGAVGFFYWEYEVEKGTSGGDRGEYHTYAVGWDPESKGVNIVDDLCRLYDEASITDYGYGYFYEGGANGAVSDENQALLTNLFGVDNENYLRDETVSEAITKQKANVEYKWESNDSNDPVSNGTWVPVETTSQLQFVAFRATEKKGSTESNYLIAARNEADTGNNEDCLTWTLGEVGSDKKPIENNSWKIDDNSVALSVTFNPDFACAMCVTITSTEGVYTNTQYDLGEKNNPYQIRTIDQLDNINCEYTNGAKRYLIQGSTANGNFTAKTHSYSQTHDLIGDGYSGFRPIGNETYQFCGVYDGGSYRIMNLTIEGTKDERFVGLFGVILHADVSNVIMFSDNNTEISVNYNNRSENYGWGAGGLVGAALSGATANTKIYNCAVAGYRIVDNTGVVGSGAGDYGIWGGAIGGLAGWCNLSVENCSAVTTLVNNCGKIDTYYKINNRLLRMGGLVGSGGKEEGQGSVTYTNCYTGGKIVLMEDDKVVEKRDDMAVYAAGIVAHCEIALIKDVNSVKTTNVNTSALELKNCYTYCEIPCNTYEAGNWQSNAIVTQWSKVGNDNKTIATIKNCYYLNETDEIANVDLLGTDTLKENNIEGTTGLTYDDMTKLEIDGFGTAAASYPSSDYLNGLSYPFPAVCTATNAYGGQQYLVHHGDWPLKKEEAPTTLLAYFEEYDDGKYQLFVGTESVYDSGTRNTGTAALLSDGYVLLSTEELLNAEFKAQGEELKAVEMSCSVGINGVTYKYAYTLSVDDLTTEGFYRTLTVETPVYKTVTYIFSPFFAYGVVGSAGSEMKDVYIRSVRQLQNLSKVGDKGDNRNFYQTLKIDGSVYRGAETMEGMGEEKYYPFTPIANYDKKWTYYGNGANSTTGDGLPISHLYISGEGDVGLFGNVSGSVLYNIYLTDCVIENLTSDEETDACTGGLFGYMSTGKISGCKVESCAIYGGSGINSYTGGLVGQRSEGTTQNCTVTGCTIYGGRGSSSSYTGGLIGYYSKEETLSNCKVEKCTIYRGTAPNNNNNKTEKIIGNGTTGTGCTADNETKIEQLAP